MRFGKTLKASIYPPWEGKYIDYAKLKSLLRERDLAGDDSDSETQPWTEIDEESFVQELINVQLDKVNAFQSETSQQLRERTNACEAKLMPLAKRPVDDGTEHDASEDKKWKQIAEEVVVELDNITKEVSELEKYSRINFSGFLKAAKKHDRKRGARYRIRPLLQVRLSELSFNSEDYSPLLHRLSAMYTFTRQLLGIGLPDDQEAGAETRPIHDAYVSYKFWVHTDNVVEVKTHILRRLPVLLYNPTTSKELDVSQRDPTITSLYFDNSSFDLYNQKVTRASEAESLRLRWSGDLNESPAIFLEKKTALEDNCSRETRVQLKAKHVQEFLRGEYKFEKKVTRLEGRAQGGSQAAEALKTEVEELQTFIKEKDLQPMLRANYTRTAFQIPGDDRIRISLDTNLALIREDALDPERPCRDPEDWHRRDIDELAMEYPFSSIHKGEIVRFPHALLEIKLRNSARNVEWLNDLMVSHLVKEAPRFSKFVHGVAQLFEDNINTLPFWLGELENDIRQDPQTAFQHEQERLAQRAEEDLVVGSFLGSKSSPLQSMMGAGRGSPGRSSMLTGTSPVIERTPRPSVTRESIQAMKPSPAADAITSQPAAERGPEAETRDEGATSSSYLENLFPSFSKSRYAQAHRGTAALPPGVSAPEVWIKDTGPVRVESKVWLANQRTFIKWQHVSILLASLSLALYNAADINNTVAQALAIIYTAFAVFASIWGWYMYEKRARLIRERSGKDLDNLFGPLVVCFGLAAALVLNFGFKYRAALNEARGNGVSDILANTTATIGIKLNRVHTQLVRRISDQSMLHEEVSRPVTEALIWTFVAVSSLFMAARLYTRLRIVHKIGLDDYITGVSLICAYLFAALVSTSIYWGMGAHADTLNTQQTERALLYSTASFAPGILSFTVPKLGVTALLIRILNPSPRTALGLWIFVGAVVLLNFGCVIILFAQCAPTRALWVPALREQVGTRCWSADVLADYSIVTGALSALVDLFLAVYPATVLWKLQMNRKKKIGLSMILGMGVFACAISIYKTTRLTGLDSGPDSTYNSFSVFLWTSIEGNTIIIAACIPTIAPLLESIFGRRVFYNASSEPSYVMPTYCEVCNNFVCRRGQNTASHSTSKNHSNSNPKRQRKQQQQQFKSPTHSTSITIARNKEQHCQEGGSSTLIISATTSRHSHSHGHTHNAHKKNKTYNMSRSDLESQTSILESDDEFELEHGHGHEHDDNSIPMDHIARRDEFTLAYERFERRESMSGSEGTKKKKRRSSAVLQAWRGFTNHNQVYGHNDGSRSGS
ncbi:hypothetical protein UA08_05876 [Talaromyces atroroseus]|uniref:SPX domain-containing protein n=1 Tax=Talaromyces atroroseus TaxID=1441469 RepID=A0A225AVP4_TALAT|nr:hypothetical protein UA08_05876 [Talaromyces atroroseus]OKL59036.1 hypothetical protein UA08_05876 [Talaromyces atroroseus]